MSSSILYLGIHYELYDMYIWVEVTQQLYVNAVTVLHF